MGNEGVEVVEKLSSRAGVDLFCEKEAAVLLVYPIGAMGVGLAWTIYLDNAEKLVISSLIERGGPPT